MALASIPIFIGSSPFTTGQLSLAELKFWSNLFQQSSRAWLGASSGTLPTTSTVSSSLVCGCWGNSLAPNRSGCSVSPLLTLPFKIIERSKDFDTLIFFVELCMFLVITSRNDQNSLAEASFIWPLANNIYSIEIKATSQLAWPDWPWCTFKIWNIKGFQQSSASLTNDWSHFNKRILVARLRPSLTISRPWRAGLWCFHWLHMPRVPSQRRHQAGSKPQWQQPKRSRELVELVSVST